MQSRAKNYLIILLAFATATAGTIAWRQNQRLNSLQAELLAAKTAPSPRKAAARPQPSVATVADTKTATDAAVASADAPPSPQARQQRNNNRPNLTALMANPEFAKAWNIERRSQLDNRYAGLFKQLNLSASQLESFKNLLVERDSAAMDVYAAARDKGIDPRADRDAINKLVAESQADVDQSIKAALGDTGYQQYQNYQTTQPQRAVVSQLEQRLSYSATPLTSTQSSFLVQALSTQSTDAAATAIDQSGGPGGPGSRGGNTVAITDAVIQQAQSVLTPDQVTALKDLQAQQQAQQKMSQIFRTNNGGNRAPGGN
ncbi:MAG: hypothetical protein WC661_06030 [Opitutaceae bacterium]|jgi:hypothetical protein